MNSELTVVDDQHRVGALLLRRREALLKSPGLAHFARLNRHPQSRRDIVQTFQRGDRRGVVRVPEHGDARCSWNGLLEELQILHLECVKQKCDPGHIAAGPRQAAHQPRGNRVPNHCHDWDLVRNTIGGHRVPPCPRHDDVDLKIDKLRDDRRCKVAGSRPNAMLNDEIVAFYPSQLAQSVPECIQIYGRRFPGLQVPNARDPVALLRFGREWDDRHSRQGRQKEPAALRLGGEWHGEGTSQRGQQEAAAVHYSIT